MQIQSIQKYPQNNTQFKSVYPVRYWVAEVGGSYNPVLSDKMAKELNSKLITTIFNKRRIEVKEKIRVLTNFCKTMKLRGEKCRKEELELKKYENIDFLQRKLAQDDRDYMGYPFIRAFYNKNGGYRNNQMEPVAYFATGQDAEYLEENYGKRIGQIRANMPKGMKSAELDRAISDYWRKGFHFVKSRSKQFRQDVHGIPKELHVKMETIRTKTGKIKGYNIIDFGFFPVEGEKNPFVMTEWLKNNS